MSAACALANIPAHWRRSQRLGWIIFSHLPTENVRALMKTATWWFGCCGRSVRPRSCARTASRLSWSDWIVCGRPLIRLIYPVRRRRCLPMSGPSAATSSASVVIERCASSRSSPRTQPGDGKTPESEIVAWPWLPSQGGPEVKIPGHVRFVEARRLWERRRLHPSNGDRRCGRSGRYQAAGLYAAGRRKAAAARRSALRWRASVDPIGYDCHVEENSSEPPPRRSEVESLVLRLPGRLSARKPQVLVLDTHGGGLRLRSTLLQSDLIAVVSTTGGSLYLSSARIKLQRPGTSHCGHRLPRACSARRSMKKRRRLRSETTTGQVQTLHLGSGTRCGCAQYLLPGNLGAVLCACWGVRGAVSGDWYRGRAGHVIAIDFRHDGQEGDAPCGRWNATANDLSTDGRGGFRLLILLSGGVLTSWEAHPNDDHVQSIQRLIDLGTKAAGSRVGLLRASCAGWDRTSARWPCELLLQRARRTDCGVDLPRRRSQRFTRSRAWTDAIPNKPTLERGTRRWPACCTCVSADAAR